MKSLKAWLAGLASAFISGAASAVTLMVVDPAHFNIHEGLYTVGTVALVTGAVGAAFYLKQSPIPPEWEGEERRKGNETPKV